MAQQTTVTLGGGSGGSIREDLANFISNIDRDETPFMSSIGSTKAKSTEHSWLTDEYADPAAQAVVEGSAFLTSGGSVGAGTDAVMTNRTRLNNFTQIFRAQIEVSGTSIATDTAGVSNEYAYQLRKKGVEIRRNAEFQATNATAATAVKAGSTTTRRMGSIYSYAANTAAVLGSAVVTQGAADGTAISSAGGANTAFARARLEALVTAMYGNGGKPNMFLVPHTIKTAVSAVFNSDSTTAAASVRRLDSMEKKINLAITGVITDFGFDIAIMPSYIPQFNGGANQALLYNSADIKKAVLRPMHTSKLDDNGDGKRGLIIEECTLQVMNPNSVGHLLNIA